MPIISLLPFNFKSILRISLVYFLADYQINLTSHKSYQYKASSVSIRDLLIFSLIEAELYESTWKGSSSFISEGKVSRAGEIMV